MRFLLDTNILSALMSNPHGPVRDNIVRVGAEAVFTSLIVVAEVKYGIRKKGSALLARQFASILPYLPVEGLAAPIDDFYASIRAVTEKAGKSIGQNDLLIAAQALMLDATLVTADEDFLWVPDLRVENWRRA